MKVTENCNLSCKYCYVPDGLDSGFMDFQIVKNYLSQALERDEKIDLIWHGGEPLFSGPPFFKEVLEYIESIDKSNQVNNKVQTNGTIINNEFLDLFEENDFNVGISLDGPREIHNSQRLKENGQGTYETVVNTIDQLKNRELNIGILTVLTKNSIGKEEEIYEELVSYSDHPKLNFFLPEGQGRKEEERLGITNEEFFELYRNFYDIWKNESNTDIKLSPYFEIMASFLSDTRRNPMCAFNNTCLGENYLSIDPEGQIYPCGRLAGIDEYIIGNINEKDVIKRISEVTLPNLNEKRNESIRDQCGGCEYIEICFGGCAHESHYGSNDLMHKTPYCEGKKKLFEYIKKDLKGD